MKDQAVAALEAAQNAKAKKAGVQASDSLAFAVIIHHVLVGSACIETTAKRYYPMPLHGNMHRFSEHRCAWRDDGDSPMRDSASMTHIRMILKRNSGTIIRCCR